MIAAIDKKFGGDRDAARAAINRKLAEIKQRIEIEAIFVRDETGFRPSAQNAQPLYARPTNVGQSPIGTPRGRNRHELWRQH